jgi:hypothetical protein
MQVWGFLAQQVAQQGVPYFLLTRVEIKLYFFMKVAFILIGSMTFTDARIDKIMSNKCAVTACRELELGLDFYNETTGVFHKLQDWIT